MLYRLVSDRDIDPITRALQKLEQDSPQYGYSKYPSWQKGLRMVTKAIRRGDAFIINDEVLLVVSEGVAWHSWDTCLEEVLVLSILPGRGVLYVPKVLDQLAQQRKVDAIITYDSSINNRMGKLYSRAGYRLITQTYYKEVRNGPMD